MYKVNSFAEAIEKLRNLLQYVPKENDLTNMDLAGFQYWVMKNYICDDKFKYYNTDMINEFKNFNINNQFEMAHYIMRGVWRYNNKKAWALESIINEDRMVNILK